jgi:hypothetical protein
MRDLTRKPLNVLQGRPREVGNLVVKIEARHRELSSLTPIKSGEKAPEKMCRANIIISHPTKSPMKASLPQKVFAKYPANESNVIEWAVVGTAATSNTIRTQAFRSPTTRLRLL